MNKKFKIIIVVVILPLIVSVITHFGYISGYTEGVVSKDTFLEQYDSGVYRYRVLSKYLILEVDEMLSKSKLNDMNNMLTRIAKFIDSEGNLSFYFSYFSINAIFAILSSIVFYFLCVKFLFPSKFYSVMLALLVYNTVIPLFQYVLVPYDYSAYFFNLLIIYIFLSNLNKYNLYKVILLNISIILATLNRETSVLALAFMFVVAFVNNDRNIKNVVKNLSISTAIFLITYYGLRLIYGFDSGLINKFNLINNLISPLNLFGIFVLIIAVYLIYIFINDRRIAKILNLYLIVISPYLLITLIGGITFEIRLWIPILLNLSILLLYYKNRYLSKILI